MVGGYKLRRLTPVDEEANFNNIMHYSLAKVANIFSLSFRGRLRLLDQLTQLLMHLMAAQVVLLMSTSHCLDETIRRL